MTNMLGALALAAAMGSGYDVIASSYRNRHDALRTRDLYPDGFAVSVTKEGFIVRWNQAKDDYIITEERFVDLDITTLSEREQRLLNSSIIRLERQEAEHRRKAAAAKFEQYRIEAYNQGIDPTNGQQLSRQQKRAIKRNGIPRK